MSVCQKLVMLKIRSTSVSFLSLRNLEAASEEAMQLRRLIKSSNESLSRRWVARNFRVRRTHSRTSIIVPHALVHAPQVFDNRNRTRTRTFFYYIKNVSHFKAQSFKSRYSNILMQG